MAHDEQRDTINTIIKDVEDLKAKWIAELTRSEHHLDQIAAGAQPQIDPHVAARVDKDGVITTLTIDSHAFTEYTTEKLSQVITRSLQAVFDDIDAKVRKAARGTLAEPDRSAEPRIVIKATHDSGLTVAVDQWFRPMYCNIEPRATTEGAETLRHRIEQLWRLAQQRVEHQIKSVFAAPADDSTAALGDPTDMLSMWLAQDAHYESPWPAAKVSVHAEPPSVLPVAECADDAVVVDADVSDVEKAPPAVVGGAFVGVVTASSVW